MATINGTNGSDALNGTASADVIYGRNGADVILGKSGNDTLTGGNGRDQIYGGSGEDMIKGGNGDDVLHGGSGNDEIDGGNGDDTLFGGDGKDVLNGGKGDDILSGGRGADKFVFSKNFGTDIIADLDGQDRIDLTAFTSITSVTQLNMYQVGANVVISVPGGTGGSITVYNATVGQLASQIDVACVMRGTMVQTPRGEVAVELLAIGDEVTTIDGTAKRIKWIGTRGYSRSFLQASTKIAPVLFEAGSLGPSQPSRDLYVSPEHAVFVDGVLVPAEFLVNGESIRQVADFDLIEYFHLEFDAPEVILTNGAPTESYVDHGNRRLFANYAEYVSLYGESSGDSVTRPRRFEAISGGSHLDAIRMRLSGRSRQAA